jgi:hypothetical protein
MPERYTPEEALREAQFLQEAAKRQAKQDGRDELEARYFEFMSEKLDSARKGDPTLYENALDLAERNAEVQNIDSELRRLFTALVDRASAPVMRKFRDRVEELRDFTKEQASRVSKTELANRREERKKEIVSEYIDSELKNADQLLENDDKLRQAFQGKEDQFKLLREFHFGSTTVEVIRQQLPKIIDELESRLV